MEPEQGRRGVTFQPQLLETIRFVERRPGRNQAVCVFEAQSKALQPLRVCVQELAQRNLAVAACLLSSLGRARELKSYRRGRETPQAPADEVYGIFGVESRRANESGV